MSILVEVSIGEFLDKLSILQIKADRIKHPSQLTNINNELQALMHKWEGSSYIEAKIAKEAAKLRSINEKPRDLENEIRGKEKNKIFDQEFIDMVRAIYVTNDQRAEIKRRINEKQDSRLVEEKSYANHTKK